MQRRLQRDVAKSQRVGKQIESTLGNDKMSDIQDEAYTEACLEIERLKERITRLEHCVFEGMTITTVQELHLWFKNAEKLLDEPAGGKKKGLSGPYMNPID